MDRSEFVDRFGGIFEHSPWIAERGFSHLPDQEAAPKASQVHVALCQAFREADREDRLKVLEAHPDLAGKVAVSGGLTEASRGEQAGAGLDRLSEDEHQHFADLNRRYRQQFGFPFIIAVKGLGKEDILRAFEKRLTHTQAEEFTAACDEVEKIALLRLEAMKPET
ncbi:2-oxo-4-hydroxy-4-carboxy-5-ureidoimidazoline decarboxylase [Pararhizobium haloflavum]|uniref:2-oxo-4-hydroxy-4-carboxy-5-ureidoimidazoline decarboxylase n=1 Tax=Pararhizobium haloflavum TaxID=2037914 RepID=UPI000C1913F2|nr:2-oxo-4-hydroxy-4-carboxy-5-ureidoimidazoline decarboxylase [Pararhizobium haloflavum]